MISDVHGTDIRSPSSSKPNVALVFNAHFVEKHAKSTVKTKTLAPVWGEGDIPPLVPIVRDPVFLERQFVFVALTDHDNHEIIGTGHMLWYHC